MPSDNLPAWFAERAAAGMAGNQVGADIDLGSPQDSVKVPLL